MGIYSTDGGQTHSRGGGADGRVGRSNTWVIKGIMPSSGINLLSCLLDKKPKTTKSLKPPILPKAEQSTRDGSRGKCLGRYSYTRNTVILQMHPGHWPQS